MNHVKTISTDKWTFDWTLSAPTQDPFLLIEFDNDTTAVCFDCGMRIWGKVRTVLKLKHLFISHAHIDHLIGFDHIIRSLLGENKTLHIHGPAGIAERLECKLRGYDWDRSAEQELVLEINEYSQDKRLTTRHACNNQFKATGQVITESFAGPIVDESRFQVWTVPVEHGGSPCNAYVLKEKQQEKICKTTMQALGLKPGPWVGQLLTAFRTGELSDFALTDAAGHSFTGQNLADQLIRIQPGKTVVYVTDTVFRERWLERLKALATGADLVVCESTFVKEDKELAEKYHHMTSVQAATVAKSLNAEKLMLFHVSSRYHPKIYRVVQEARRLFPQTDMVHIRNKKKH